MSKRKQSTRVASTTFTMRMPDDHHIRVKHVARETGWSDSKAALFLMAAGYDQLHSKEGPDLFEEYQKQARQVQQIYKAAAALHLVELDAKAKISTARADYRAATNPITPPPRAENDGDPFPPTGGPTKGRRKRKDAK